MAYYCINVQKQLHTILETLTKGAVAEIGKLIEDGSAVLRLEIIHSQKENETLKMKLQEIERELETAREYGRKREEELKDVFATRCRLPAEEKDLRQRVVVEQSRELLSESVIKEEDQENSLGGDWRGDILEAERSVGAEWGSRLSGDLVAEIQASPVAAQEQFGWGEPEMMQGDSEDGYAGFCYANEGRSFPVSEGGGSGPEPFKEEAGMLPLWSEEAGSGMGIAHQRRYRSQTESRVGRVRQLLKPCSVRVGSLTLLQDSSRKPQNSPACETPAYRSHAIERPFLCSYCGKAFAWNTSLNRHLQSHAQQRPFSCATCGKGFSRKYQLKMHLRTHTGEKPYSCPECGKCFHRLDILKTHQRIHTRVRKFV